MDISLTILAIAIIGYGFFIIHPGLVIVFGGAIVYSVARNLADRS